MRNISAKDIRIGFCVIGAVAMAVLFRLLADGIAEMYFFNKLFNFIRTFIYIALFSLWGVSVNHRVIQTQVRRMMVFVSVTEVLWVTVREIKYRFVFSITLIRYLWYSYYIPMIVIPLIALLVALSLGKPADYRLKKRIKLLFVPAALLIAAFMTNDIHQMCFVFPENRAVWSEEAYRYGYVYFITAGWMILCSISALIVMINKCRIPQSRKFIWLPFVPWGISVIQFMLYVAGVGAVRYYMGDIAVFFSLIFTAFFESCIQSGLIQSNSRYTELFSASDKMPVWIVDDENTIHYKTKDAPDISREDMKRITEGDELITDGKRIRKIKVRGGYAIWEEDISELLDIRERLWDRGEEIMERNAFLKYEYEREKEHKMIDEQNRLYDILQRGTQSRLDLIDRLITDYRKEENAGKKKKLLSYIVVIGSYIKRKKDLILSADSAPVMPQAKLENAFGESFRAMRLLGIKGGYAIRINREYISGKTISDAYDFFEDIIENLLDRAGYINVMVSEIYGKMRIAVLSDSSFDTEALIKKYPEMLIQTDEDGSEEFILSFEGGVSV